VLCCAVLGCAGLCICACDVCGQVGLVGASAEEVLRLAENAEREVSALAVDSANFSLL
jgi:hypothetical protein